MHNASHTITRQRGNTAPQTIAPPALTPGHYLKLRRQKAGLSIEQVAERMAPAVRDRADMLNLLRTLESDAARARHDGTLAALGTVYCFDISVYRQLHNEPADRHPLICRGCGCSRDVPCEHDAGLCHFVSPYECSTCSDVAARARRCAA